jgi:hypothetical protein
MIPYILINSFSPFYLIKKQKKNLEGNVAGLLQFGGKERAFWRENLSFLEGMMSWSKDADFNYY